MNIIIGIVVVIIIIVVCIVFLNFSSFNNPKIQLVPPSPDMNDCSKYVDTLNFPSTCPPGERFDLDYNVCRNYYLVNCGVRYNPPYPSSSELCEPYKNQTIVGETRFPVRNAQYYADCNSRDATGDTTKKCDNGLFYEIKSQQCVETLSALGYRCVGEECPIE